MTDITGYILIIIGIIFNICGCIGLVRFPDVYNRLQASTKCVTLGTLGIMIGIFLTFLFLMLRCLIMIHN